MGNVHCYSPIKTKSSRSFNKNPLPSSKNGPNQEDVIHHKNHESVTIINLNQCVIFSEHNSSSIFNYTDIAKANLIGKGRFSNIFLGLAKSSGKLVTIKVIDNISTEKRNCIVQNLELLYQLQHPNIVKAIRVPDCAGMNKCDSGISLYYEYSNGVTIENLIKQFGELNEKTIQIYVKQIIEGLAYLHSHGFVHKNLKASNILVEGNGLIKISDVLIDNILLGMNEEMIETLLKYPQIQYTIPPFFMQNINKDIDISYDFWCLGCVIIEMATAKNPWEYYQPFNKQQDFFDFIQSIQINPSIPSYLSQPCQSLISLLFDYKQTKYSDIYKKLSEHDFFNSFATSVAVLPKPTDINQNQQRDLGSLLKNGNVNDVFKQKSWFEVSVSASLSNSISNNNSNIYVNRLSSGKEIISERKKIISVVNQSVIQEEEGYSIQKMNDLCYISRSIN